MSNEQTYTITLTKTQLREAFESVAGCLPFERDMERARDRYGKLRYVDDDIALAWTLMLITPYRDS